MPDCDYIYIVFDARQTELHLLINYYFISMSQELCYSYVTKNFNM